jgi:hypothetical protein
MIRCPNCSATNPDTSPWCGQCYTSFTTPTPAPETAPAERPVPDTVAATSTDATNAVREAGGFRRADDDRLEWACVNCGTYNPLELTACEVCGTSFGARFEGETQERGPADYARARRSNAFLPGLGHIQLGQSGSGLARMVLFVIWTAGGIALALSGPRAVIAALPLLGGGAFIYGASLLDVDRLRTSRPELLAGRTLLWLVVGVTLGTLVLVLVSALLGRSAAGGLEGALG